MKYSKQQGTYHKRGMKDYVKSADFSMSDR